MTGWMFWGILGFVCLLMLLYYLRRRRKVRSVLVGGGTGLLALLCVHAYGDAIGISLPLTSFNLVTAGVLGVPGVGLLLILQAL